MYYKLWKATNYGGERERETHRAKVDGIIISLIVANDMITENNSFENGMCSKASLNNKLNCLFTKFIVID